ncbi:MAG: D-cysteine desulfhydrase family protein [Candidatus Kapaibacterium sp.]
MKTFSKLHYSILPTPLHKLENLSKRFKTDIYCKRDDLTGFAFGGNKTRKLDYLIYEAIQNEADTIIAVGAYQSNFCRIASAYGAATGLEVWLVLGGIKPEKTTGNLLLDNLFGAKIHDVDSFNWDDWEKEAGELKKALEDQGKKVYQMPIGGSTRTGALGYIDCMKEIKEFSDKDNTYFRIIFHATGSAGTQAGLVVGKSITGYDTIINGFAITKNAKQITDEVEALCNETAWKIEKGFKKEDIVVDDGYIGESYGAVTREANEAISLFAREEGILLDGVYSGKAAAGMIDYIRKGKFNTEDNLLFIHTGGNIQLFK